MINKTPLIKLELHSDVHNKLIKKVEYIWINKIIFFQYKYLGFYSLTKISYPYKLKLKLLGEIFFR